MSGINSSLAAFVVTGQGNFRQLATTALESFIQVGLGYLESKLFMVAANAIFGSSQDKQTAQTIASNAAMAISAAGLSAANTLALASGVYLPPVPEALSAAAFSLGLGYAADAAAMRGAILPNRDMMVHTHPEEMILPQHIANFVVNAASNASGGGRTIVNHNNPVFAPVINAIDASGVDRMLKEHGARFHREFHETIRRMNF
jgi:hypothetical protein